MVEEAAGKQFKLLICHLTRTAPTHKLVLTSYSRCLFPRLIKKSMWFPRLKERLSGVQNLIFTFSFDIFWSFADWGILLRAGDRHGNRLQGGDLQQGFMMDDRGVGEERRGRGSEDGNEAALWIAVREKLQWGSFIITEPVDHHVLTQGFFLHFSWSQQLFSQGFFSVWKWGRFFCCACCFQEQVRSSVYRNNIYTVKSFF